MRGTVLVLMALLLSGCARQNVQLIGPPPVLSQRKFEGADNARIAIARDRITVQRGRAGVARLYHIAKAEAWLDFSADAGRDETSQATADAALNEAETLIGELERGEEPLLRTILVVASSRVRDDLWGLADGMKRSAGFRCAGEPLARAEVALVWAGHKALIGDSKGAEEIGARAEWFLDAARNVFRRCIAAQDTEPAAPLAQASASSIAPASPEADATLPETVISLPRVPRVPQVPQVPVVNENEPPNLILPAGPVPAPVISTTQVAAINSDLAASKEPAKAPTPAASVPGAALIPATPGAVAPETAHIEVVRLRTDTLFPFGATTLEVGRNEAVRDLAQRIRLIPNVLSVRIHGHTDRLSLSGKAFNFSLSTARARAVADALAANGVEAALIEVVGHGDASPIVDCPGRRNNATIACLAPNRRVEIEIELEH